MAPKLEINVIFLNVTSLQKMIKNEWLNYITRFSGYSQDFLCYFNVNFQCTSDTENTPSSCTNKAVLKRRRSSQYEYFICWISDDFHQRSARRDQKDSWEKWKGTRRPEPGKRKDIKWIAFLSLISEPRANEPTFGCTLHVRTVIKNLSSPKFAFADTAPLPTFKMGSTFELCYNGGRVES